MVCTDSQEAQDVLVLEVTHQLCLLQEFSLFILCCSFPQGLCGKIFLHIIITTRFSLFHYNMWNQMIQVTYTKAVLVYTLCATLKHLNPINIWYYVNGIECRKINAVQWIKINRIHMTNIASPSTENTTHHLQHWNSQNFWLSNSSQQLMILAQ